MFSPTLIQYVLTAALRDKLVWSLMIVFILGASLSVFLGSAAVIEKDQYAFVFAGSIVRLAAVMGLVLFVVFFVRRCFEAKDVEFMLSRPIGRVQFLLSYAAGFSIIGILTAAAQGGALFILSFTGQQVFDAGEMLWTVSVAVENIIMVNVALFFAMFFTSASAGAMACFAFYVLGRMSGAILGIVDSGVSAGNPEAMEFTMQVVSAMMPRLDLMGQSAWLVYGPETEIGFGFVLVQGFVFVVLVLSAALLDLVKRQF